MAHHCWREGSKQRCVGQRGRRTCRWKSVERLGQGQQMPKPKRQRSKSWTWWSWRVRKKFCKRYLTCGGFCLPACHILTLSKPANQLARYFASLFWPRKSPNIQMCSYLIRFMFWPVVGSIHYPPIIWYELDKRTSIPPGNALRTIYVS